MGPEEVVVGEGSWLTTPESVDGGHRDAKGRLGCQDPCEWRWGIQSPGTDAMMMYLPVNRRTESMGWELASPPVLGAAGEGGVSKEHLGTGRGRRGHAGWAWGQSPKGVDTAAPW